MDVNKRLRATEKAFDMSLEEMRRIIKDFHNEMENGLSGSKSSLKMIPTYVDSPSGREKGIYIALDLGGTNFRVLEVELKGGGKTVSPKISKYVLAKRHMTGTAALLFNFLARCIKDFTRKQRIDQKHAIGLGFTFSFAVEQNGPASGRLVKWTKGFSAKGVLGRDVVRLLDDALARSGMENIKVWSLANDTVGTLASCAYSDKTCDIGVIIGTGTNACYREEIRNIHKWRGPQTATPRRVPRPSAAALARGRPEQASEASASRDDKMGAAGFARGGATGHMIINTEWGNFNRLPLTRYDRLLNSASDNKGEQILEKMVSGMYLGRLAGLVIKYLIKVEPKKPFKTEYMSEIESDRTNDLSKTRSLLKKIGVDDLTKDDLLAVKRACALLSRRAARISAAAIAAVVTKIDPDLSRMHSVGIDGSVYEKHPEFSGNIKIALNELFGRKARRIKLVLVKDGSGKGSAIIAAATQNQRPICHTRY